jgi:hypothetical protein
MISTSNTAQVSADLRAAIGQIKAAQLGAITHYQSRPQDNRWT